jgi:hypothetical protein
MDMIPENEIEFRADIRKMLMDFAYVSPDMLLHSESWYKFETIMHKHIPIVNTPLKQAIVEVYTGQSFTVGALELEEVGARKVKA